ncbi:MAG TPA: hypothetical protein VEP90_15790 [Methylomirabilota bacterium]|nr:hypothetical protein [Methylomirabilota bacterium]
MLKECKKCQAILPLEYFRKGRHVCKACRSKNDRIRRNRATRKYRKCYNCQRILPIERFYEEKRNICKSCRVLQITKNNRKNELTLGDIRDGRVRDTGALLMRLKEVHHSPPGTKGYQP